MFARRRFDAAFILILVSLSGSILLVAGCSSQVTPPPNSSAPIASTPSAPITPASLQQGPNALPTELGTVQDGSSMAESAYATAWPVTINAPQGRIELYQPQPDSLAGDELKARAAVSLTKPRTAEPTTEPATTEPVFGAIWFSARIVTDRDARIVTLTDINIRHVRLPNASADQDRDFSVAIGAQLSQHVISFPLDQLMTSLDLAQREQAEKQEFSTTPPRILFSAVPATLIVMHGPPALRPVQDVTGVSRVVNTPFIMLFDTGTKRYYLKAGSRWVDAAEVPGPWENAKDVPGAITTAGEALTGSATRPTSGPGALADLAESTADTRIIVATEPSELIVTEGDPRFAALPGSQLFYCTNTKANLFLDQDARQYYLLLSGRWFAAASPQGAWAFIAADKLPPAFAGIPADSPRAGVLPFVAGTTQAREAVLDAAIPQTAAISRDAGKDLTVPYDGPPKFEPIQGTAMSYAVNSPDAVIQLNGEYYCCHEAVWYDSDSPTGPWAVCVAVPPEIYTIPPSCPIYNVRYVHVYDYYPDVAYVGYQSGYLESYVYGPTVVYGTGYDYAGYLGDEDYIAPPSTWGFGAYYDPWVCDWGFGFGCFWGPDWFIDFHHHHEHDPGHTWGYHHWWGPRGFVSYHRLQEVHAAGAVAGVHAANWSAHLNAHFHNIYQRSYNVHRVASAATLGAYEHSRAIGPGVRESTDRANNIFAGHNGDIYRRTETGWESRQGNAWQGMQGIPEARPSYRPPPAPTYHPYSNPNAGMERSSSLRSRGAERSFGFHGGAGFHGGGRR